MRTMMVGGVLRAIAGCINMVAAVLAPKREVDIFPHRLWAAGKSWRHWDAYRDGPGSVTVEAGGWSVDICWQVSGEAATRPA